jgi:hypothetical protein
LSFDVVDFDLCFVSTFHFELNMKWMW